MPIVSITDVFTRVREVEVPDHCPGRPAEGRRPAEPCGADLHEPGALQVWEWNEAVWPGRLGTIDEESSDEVEQGGVLLDAIAGSDRGDGWIEHVAYYCRACGACLAEGDRRDLDTRTAPPPASQNDSAAAG